MIVRQVSLKVRDGQGGAFERFWASEYRKAMSTKHGFLDARLLKYADAEDEYQMLLEFATEEDSAAWRASPEHTSLSPRLKAFAPATALRVLSPVE